LKIEILIFSPKIPTKFFLSIHSLSLPKKKFIESQVEDIFYRKNKFWSIPKGIFRLFFSDDSKRPNDLIDGSLTPKQIFDGIYFLKKFSKGYLKLPTPNHILFLSILQFHADILKSCLLFFFPNEGMISIFKKEFIEYQ
jgi:hypothetical protein